MRNLDYLTCSLQKNFEFKTRHEHMTIHHYIKYGKWRNNTHRFSCTISSISYRISNIYGWFLVSRPAHTSLKHCVVSLAASTTQVFTPDFGPRPPHASLLVYTTKYYYPRCMKPVHNASLYINLLPIRYS